MRKKIATTIATVSFFLPSLALANATVNGISNETIPINRLLLVNFVNTHCHDFRPKWTVLDLDERFYNKVGYGSGAVSCKGEICWSWGIGKNIFDWQLYSSNLPLRISNTEKITKSISQTVKNSQSLRKSSNDIISAVQEFLQAGFGTGKEQSSVKERTITESKSQEQAIETNITTLFHRFLSMGLQSTYTAIYPFCFSAAADLFYKAYNTNRVNDLVEAFVIFQTVKPKDLKLSNEKTFLNRAKLLYLIMAPNKEKEQFAWASATIFAKLLEWDEFQDVKKIVDNYIDKVYEKYQLLKTHTTRQLIELDKELAIWKYFADKLLEKENKTQDIPEIEDRYAYIAIAKFFPTEEKEAIIKELQTVLDEALKQNDPLLNAKLLKEEPAIVKIVKDKPVVTAGIGIGGALGLAGIGTLYLKRKKQNQDKKEE